MNVPAFSKTYDGVKVLNFPGMSFEKGRIYAILGANGSGKSTFAKILSGMLPSDQKKTVRLGSGLGYLPQKNYAFRMSVRDNLMLNGTDAARADALLDALQIRHLQHKKADRLSGGETARMALARIMMKSYNVLILDEPTAAMDIETTILSEKLIQQYVQETGCTLLMITHSLQQAKRIADELLFFHEGMLLEHGAKENLLTSPQTKELRQFLEFYGL
ncbi:MAG: ATP-binding cassette domain-containing protein [Peptococcaceae bacterium]|nr:ATP-binding cassette domain-containing protein [Peptococcaceae bacterium]MBO5429208.1 ATP-binding cassette domain-containing protein [Peptococcaceae bacterium]MBP3342661.1 ATP-binding cassette domain-containing protein [Peptococcaceae bacterium]MBP3626036.1 ATP-binding cassette domain-containing protein [Peptococcaceae bacterium]MBQ3205690.1 ATP-binding cassette domain-containing protein [Peptococcaceae bacterium]